MMRRFTWATATWAALVASFFHSSFSIDAFGLDQSIILDNLSVENIHSRDLDESNDASGVEFAGIGTQINGEVTKTTTQTKNETESLGYSEIDEIERIRRKNRLIDILVSCFFFVAAVWLIMATMYSFILMILLRLQARGELDIYDENLGRVVLCNGRLTMHFGCILRRYAIQLEEDYQQQIQQQFGDSNTGSEDHDRRRIRIMTREERRNAVEELLGGSQKIIEVEHGCTDIKRHKNGCGCHNQKSHSDVLGNKGTSLSADTSFTSSDEGPICSICLVEYEPEDTVFKSKACPHMFHGECLFSWLERRNNTECPVCREPLVSDDDIWAVIQRIRKERRKKLQKENGPIHRLVRWMKRKRCQSTEPSTSNNRPASLTSVSNGTDTDSSTSASEEYDITGEPSAVIGDEESQRQSSAPSNRNSSASPSSVDES